MSSHLRNEHDVEKGGRAMQTEHVRRHDTITSYPREAGENDGRCTYDHAKTQILSPGSALTLDCRPQRLSLLSDPEVLEEAEKFVNAKRLNKFMLLFRTAALIVHHPDDYESICDPAVNHTFDYVKLHPLREEELEFLRDEKIKRWHQPRTLYWTIILCSVGAAVQGWDQTGSNGANIFFPPDLGIPITADSPYANINAWIVGLINAAPYFSAAFLGCFLADPLNLYLGRRGAIFTAAVFCLGSVLGSASVQTWQQLLTCRLLLGIGMGVKATTIPIFATESSPASIRGALVMCWQMWVAFGILMGVSFNLAVWNTGIYVWRLQLGSAAIPAIPLVLGIYFCPESPRWYIKKNKYLEAFTSLRRLRHTDIQAARDLFYIYEQLNGLFISGKETELVNQKGTGYATRFLELFTEKKRLRPATIAAFIVMISQQMCGINIITFYSSTVFKDAGASDEAALWGSWGFGMIDFLFAIPALYTIDPWGRRTLLLFTFPQMAWTLFAAGCCSLIQDNTAHAVLVAMFIFIFTAFYSVAGGPVPFTYSAEVFPLSHREVGMGFAVATNLLWAAILSVTFPSMLAAIGTIGAFSFYAGLNVLAFILLFLFMPETKQCALEDLDHTFATSAPDFALQKIEETRSRLTRRRTQAGHGDEED
ncbi:hypothetical protein MMC17_009932 [Xylographa soralifera]|nr:hypothetical protein [Xylographa soralifera]